MARKYGDEKRLVIKQFREELISDLEALYLNAFEKLNDLEVGEGAVTQLTQVLLGSRGAAISPLEANLEGALQNTNPDQL